MSQERATIPSPSGNIGNDGVQENAALALQGHLDFLKADFDPNSAVMIDFSKWVPWSVQESIRRGFILVKENSDYGSLAGEFAADSDQLERLESLKPLLESEVTGIGEVIEGLERKRNFAREHLTSVNKMIGTLREKTGRQ